MALDIAHAMQTKPGGGQGGSVLVVVETGTRMWLCLATLARSKAVLLSETFKSRPFTFGAALDPSLAAVALNILNVGAGDVLLDPCTGTGTILVGGVERGALAIGMDQNFKFVCGCRANLDYLGFASVGGGFLRQRASAAWDGRCVVANHDARVPFAPEFPSLPTPTAIVTNVPHGRSNTRVRCCSGSRRAARALSLSHAPARALFQTNATAVCARTASRAHDRTCCGIGIWFCLTQATCAISSPISARARRLRASASLAAKAVRRTPVLII